MQINLTRRLNITEYFRNVFQKVPADRMDAWEKVEYEMH